MRRAPTAIGADDRGVSEVVGAVLLVSLAIVGSLVVVGTGAIALGTVDEQVDRQNAQSVLQEMDSRFDSLISSSDTPRTEIDLGDARINNFELVHGGHFSVTVNNNPACSVNETLSGIRYEGPQGQAYLYQTGGVWALNDDSSTAVTLPNVEYRDGAIDVSLNNISGRISGSRVTIVEDVSESRRLSRDARRALVQEGCVRPDNVTIQLSSRAYRGWADYLEEETNTSVTTFESNQTVRLTLSQSQLPRTTDDSRNTVVNLSQPSYMRNVTLDAGRGTISVDKGANNTYGVFAEPLTEDRLDIARVRALADSVNATRPPIDVMLVIDESGSMGNDDGDSRTRSQEAQAAAESFLADLNSSRDRAGVISYESGDSPGEEPRGGAIYRRTVDGQYLSGDFDAVNGSIQDIPDYPGGGTDIEQGIFKANNVLGLQSDDNRKQVIIALTDGVNNGCTDTNDDDPYDCDDRNNNRLAMDQVNQSARDGTTVYTIGFGDDSDIDKAFLREAATQSGGKFYQAENASALTTVFEEIRQDVNEQLFVTRTPVSTNFTAANGQVVAPQIAGDDGDIANYTANGETFLNVNDPTAPSKFSHAFAVSDGESVSVNVSRYDCETYEQIDRTYTNNSNTYSVARCADIDESAGVNESYQPDEILLNGDNAAPLIDGDRGFWENDLNETLTQYPSVRYNSTSGEVEMDSNQAILLFNLDLTGRPTQNKLAILYEIGLSESESTAEGVINVDINRLQVGA